MLEHILSVLGMLVTIAVTLALAYFATRYVAKHGIGGYGGTGRGDAPLGVLAQLTLGRGQRILVVHAGQRILLLGVAAEKISLLAELTEDEAAPFLTEQPKPQDTAFLEAMRKIIAQKRK